MQRNNKLKHPDIWVKPKIIQEINSGHTASKLYSQFNYFLRGYLRSQIYHFGSP